MALLPEDEQKKNAEANAVGPIPVAKQPQKKGTGFTNLNRIMQANQGNRLGQTVAGGVSGAATGLKSNIIQSQAGFQTEAEKNRLDTDANRAQRSGVLGRFDASTYKPDESKFQVSSGLQEQYGGQKTELEKQEAARQTSATQQQASIQARLNADRAAMGVGPVLKAVPRVTPTTSYQEVQAIREQNDAATRAYQWKVRGYEASIGSLKGLMDVQQAAATAAQTEAASTLAGLESQYGTMSAAEKANFMKTETDRLMAENAPTSQEITDFTKFQTGAYTGPKELQDYQTLIGKAQQAESLGGLSRSAGGRQELLKQFVGGRDYTQGQRGLDEAILGQDKSSALSQAAKQVRGSEASVSAANKLAGSQAQDLVNKAQAFGKETQGMIGEKRGVISADIDKQVAALQGNEAQRVKNAASIQEMLTSADPKYAQLDKTTRMGLALQSAADAGYLTPQEAEQLVGKGGLVQRAQAAGLDPNALLGERLKSIMAQGIDRRAGATGAQEGIISAMDKLSGKVGPDVEFGSGAEQYQAGKTNFDVNSLRDYIAKTEAEKMKDPKFAAQMQKSGMTPLQQSIGGVGQMLGAGPGGIGGTLATGGTLTGVQAVTDLVTGGDTAAQVGEGGVQFVSGNVGTGLQGRDAILKAMIENSPGGKLASSTPQGKQLLKLLEYKQQLDKQGLGELTKEGMTVAGGYRDLTSGKLDQAIAKITGAESAKNIAGNVANTYGKAIGDVGKAVSTAFGGGKTGNWGTHEYNTIDAGTGKKVKIGTYANKSSSDILKQMMSKSQMDRTAAVGKGGAEGAKAMNELLKYYNAALKREKGK